MDGHGRKAVRDNDKGEDEKQYIKGNATTMFKKIREHVSLSSWTFSSALVGEDGHSCMFVRMVFICYNFQSKRY